MADRRLTLSVMLALATGWAAAAVDPATVAHYRRHFEGRAAQLRVPLLSDPHEVALTSQGPVQPPAAGRTPRMAVGDRVRILSVRFGPDTVEFGLTTPDRTRASRVRFRFEQPLDPLFSDEALFTAGVEDVFLFRARVGPVDPPESEPDGAEETAPEAEIDDPPDAEPDPQDLQVEIRLLVEPAASPLPGDGDTVTSVAISARDPDGRLMENVSGAVDIRINAGRLSAERVQMTGGLARVNLQVPILDDEIKVMQRAILVTWAIMERFIGSGLEADPVAIARDVALQGPNLAALSTARGDKPYVLIVAELQGGVKGKARIDLTPSSTAAGPIAPGVYRGKDITGATTWTFDTRTMIITQEGSPDEIPVRFTGEGGLGFRQIELGGLTTSVFPMPGGSFYLFAPPVMFHRVHTTPTTPSAPEPIQPRPTVTLTARQNPIAGDGQSTTEVIFQYLDERGRPKAGLALEWALGPRMPEEQLGRLLSSESRTRADGTARAVYQAGRMDDAASMQETGGIKNRDVSVFYSEEAKRERVNCQVGLMRAAPVMLVVEKPGLERTVLPIQVASLNGTLTGRVLLRAVDYRLPGAPTRMPLRHATVRLEGDERILRWAAVEPAITDDEGNFTIRMRMRNWPRWDKEFEKPFLAAPSARFLGLQQQALRNLELWAASEELKQATRYFVLGAQPWLAELKPEEAEGLQAKLELYSWMLLVLKDTRKDALAAAGEFLGHAWSVLASVASYCYADSQLDKYIKEKYKQLEQYVGLRRLRALKARWEKSQSQPTSLSGRVHRYLTKWWYRSPIFLQRSDDRQMRGVVRGTLNELLIPQILKAISDYMGQWLPDVPMPDIKGMISGAMLRPYDKIGNRFMLVFLQNQDYRRIRATHIPAYAQLKTRHHSLALEFQRITDWRITQDYLKVFMETVSECGQITLKIVGTVYAMPNVVKAAETLDKIHKALDTALAGVRFIEELYRFVAILEKSLDIVLTCMANLAGVPAPDLLARLTADEHRLAMDGSALFVPGEPTPRLGMAEHMDWNAFTAPDGRVSEVALAYLIESDEVLAAWQVGVAPGLLALGQVEPDRLRICVEAMDNWEALRRELLLLALTGLERPLGDSERRQWDDRTARFRQDTQAVERLLDDACRTIDRLPAPPAAAVLASVEGQTRGGLLAGLPGWAWWAAGVGVALALGATLLVGVVWLRLSRRRAAAPGGRNHPPAPTPTAAQTPDRAVTPPPLPSLGPHLIAAEGTIHPLTRECTDLGSDPGNTVVIAAEGVSRYHARVWRSADNTFWVEDLGSTNGTHLNSHRVEREWLQPEDVITIGHWHAWFRTD